MVKGSYKLIREVINVVQHTARSIVYLLVLRKQPHIPLTVGCVVQVPSNRRRNRYPYLIGDTWSKGRAIDPPAGCVGFWGNEAGGRGSEVA